MFKLMLRYNNEGEFIDTVYPACEYSRAVALLKSYRQRWGNVHTYILVSTELHSVVSWDTGTREPPLAPTAAMITE